MHDSSSRLTSSLERRAFMWDTPESGRGSCSTQRSRLSARARARGMLSSGRFDWDVLEGERGDAVF